MIGPCVQCQRDLTRCTLIYTVQGLPDMKDGSHCEPCYTHHKRGTEARMQQLGSRLAALEARVFELERR